MALSALPVLLVAGDVPPTEFRVFKAGENPSEKGTFIFDEKSALSVMEEFARLGKPMLLDYNHGTLVEGAAPEASISAGEGLPEVRNGELWLTGIKWTARASQLLTAKEYRLFSPYFHHDKDGHVTRLVNVALTNLPALNNIEPLVAASANPTEEPSMETCTACAQLNAKLSAMDEECKALKAKLSAFEKKDEEATTRATALTALTGQATAAAALGTVEGWKKKAEGYDKLAAESAAREEQALTASLTAALDAGATEGKVPPAGKDSLKAAVLKMGAGKVTKDGVEWLTAHIAALPKLVATTEKPQPDPAEAGSIALTAREKEVLAKHGLKEEPALKAKKAEAERKARLTG